MLYEENVWSLPMNTPSPDAIRNLAFVRADGSTFALHTLLDRPLLLIFLRHLG
jgi:hypothetical protein